MPDDPLDSDLQADFDALPREIAPPADLESRVVARLRAGGRLRRSRPPVRAWTAAAAVVLFGTGFALGRGAGVAPDPTPQPQYLLLLYGAEATSPALAAARVAEYSAWARAEAAAGHVVGGEELENAGVAYGASRPIGEPTGYFLIAAASRAEAEATATRCPHVRHGGTVVLRTIVSRDAGGAAR
jgi:hypothetical protein